MLPVQRCVGRRFSGRAADYDGGYLTLWAASDRKDRSAKPLGALLHTCSQYGDVITLFGARGEVRDTLAHLLDQRLGAVLT